MSLKAPQGTPLRPQDGKQAGLGAAEAGAVFDRLVARTDTGLARFRASLDSASKLKAPVRTRTYAPISRSVTEVDSTAAAPLTLVRAQSRVALVERPNGSNHREETGLRKELVPTEI